MCLNAGNASKPSYCSSESQCIQPSGCRIISAWLAPHESGLTLTITYMSDFTDSLEGSFADATDTEELLTPTYFP